MGQTLAKEKERHGLKTTATKGVHHVPYWAYNNKCPKAYNDTEGLQLYHQGPTKALSPNIKVPK